MVEVSRRIRTGVVTDDVRGVGALALPALARLTGGAGRRAHAPVEGARVQVDADAISRHLARRTTTLAGRAGLAADALRVTRAPSAGPAFPGYARGAAARAGARQ